MPGAGTWSYRDDVVPDEVKADDTRPLALLEIASDGIPNPIAQGNEVAGLCEDGLTDRARRVAALRILSRDENQLIHLREDTGRPSARVWHADSQAG